VTQLWGRASLPSQNTIVTAGGFPQYIPVDGTLNARQSTHTYDNTLYRPVIDRYVTFGGASTNSGSFYAKQTGPTSVMPTGPYFWDPAKGDPNKVGGTTGSGVNTSAIGGQMWNNRDYLVNSNLASATVRPGQFVQGTTAYRTEGGKDVVYVTGVRGSASGQDLWKVTFNDVADPTQDVWQMVGRAWGGGFQLGSGTLDPLTNVYVRIGNTSSLTIWDLDKAGATNNSVAIPVVNELGQSMSIIGGGLEWDPVRERLLLWNGGADVWYLDVPDRLTNGNLPTTGWVFRKDSSGTLAAPGTISTGINGKWDYVAQLDAYMGLLNTTEGQVWLYKPTDWSPVPVPEPEAYALMLAGLGLVGWAARRRARRAERQALRLEPITGAGAA